MDKNTARNSVASADLSSRDIAHSIYLATVQGISGANQTGGMGFALSAVAELWNIRGVVGNPNAKTKITGRYRGMNVTEQKILNVISKYPNGFNGSQPLFDDLLGIGVSRNNNNCQSVYDDFEDYPNQKAVFTTPRGVRYQVKPDGIYIHDDAGIEDIYELHNEISKHQEDILKVSDEDTYAEFRNWNKSDNPAKVNKQTSMPTDVYEKEDAYAGFEDWDEEPEKTYQDGSQPFSGGATRYPDSVLRGFASLSVIVALDLVKSLTGRDLSNSRDDLIDYAISILRKMGH